MCVAMHVLNRHDFPLSADVKDLFVIYIGSSEADQRERERGAVA